MAAARISNIADLAYSIYQHGLHFTLRRIELNDASDLFHARTDASLHLLRITVKDWALFYGPDSIAQT
jgi:hypothetical protein